MLPTYGIGRTNIFAGVSLRSTSQAANSFGVNCVALNYGFYARRAEQERALSRGALNSPVAAIHRELARHYQAKADRILEPHLVTLSIVK